jgi:hypothetical protein
MDIKLASLKLFIDDSTYILKDSVNDGGCVGCAYNGDSWSSAKCGNVRNHIEPHLEDQHDTRCGLGEYVIVEDTPEGILKYLDEMINDNREEEESE